MIRSRQPFCVFAALLISATVCSGTVLAQDFRSQSAQQAAQARMRPLGAPSAVDRYREPSRARSEFARQQSDFATRSSFGQQDLRRNTQDQNPQYRNTQDWRERSNVRQVAMMQAGMVPPPLATESTPFSGGPVSSGPVSSGQVPSGLGVSPRNAAPPLPSGDRLVPMPDPNAMSAPRTLPQRDDLRSSPASPSDLLGRSDIRSNDLAQIPQPQLNGGGFATVDNCNCVSGPSGYTAASGYGCGSNLGFVSQTGCNTPVLAPGYVAPQAQIPAPAAMPAFAPQGLGTGVAPGVGLGTGAPPRALISLGQQLNTVQVGQGLWGQPVAYVPGQSIRNWVRYFFP